MALLGGGVRTFSDWLPLQVPTPSSGDWASDDICKDLAGRILGTAANDARGVLDQVPLRCSSRRTSRDYCRVLESVRLEFHGIS